MNNWDGSVALAYAAEELLFAVQALTTDQISEQQRVELAQTHLHSLVSHEKLFPIDLARRIHALDDHYSAREDSGATDHASAVALTSATIEILGDVRNRLDQQQRAA